MMLIRMTPKLDPELLAPIYSLRMMLIRMTPKPRKELSECFEGLRMMLIRMTPKLPVAILSIAAV